MSYLSKNILNILIHLFFWGIVFIIPLFIAPSKPLRMPMPPPTLLAPSMTRLILVVSMMMGVFYVNAYWLVPQFLFKKKHFLYLLLTFLSCFVIKKSIDLANYWLMDKSINMPFPPLGFVLFPTIFVLLASTLYRFFMDKRLQEQRLQVREKENLQTELKFLRSQINPHFLFNVLNSLVSLARKKSDLVEPSLIKLSELMQYMIYDSEQESISVSDELAYLKSYIELQKLRFGNTVKIISKFDELDVLSQRIAPMLLVPLLENAFKHGTGFIGEQQIEVYFKIVEDNIHFEVKNHFYTEGVSNDKNSGIGLSNLRRRLELIYPNRHIFKTDKTDNIFHTQLIINLL
jgi:two-component system, LytTR family, sensor kinase